MPRGSKNPMDRHVGNRVRMRRMILGMSQTTLGEALGVTFQQVQKYENGTNRIGASRVQQIAQVLGVPIDFLFENGPKAVAFKATSSDDVVSDLASSFLSTAEGVNLIRAFLRISDPVLRRRIISLVQAMARDSDDELA